MKALIRKVGARGRYYQGKTLKEIVLKFMKAHPKLSFIRFDEFKSRYEILIYDNRIHKGYSYEIPKNKIIK